MLRDSGHDVTVISQAGANASELQVTGVRSLLSAQRKTAGGRIPLLAETANVVHMLTTGRDRGELDAVVSHHSILTTHIGRSLPTVPLIHTIHSPVVEEHHLTNWKYTNRVRTRLRYPVTRTALRHFERAALQAANTVHTLSDYTWNLLTNRFPEVCRATDWTRIPGTFDHRRFAPPKDRAATRRGLGIGVDETVLLTVRRLVARNGVDRILTCASALRPELRRTRFLIAGTGERYEGLAARLRGDNLGELVELLGFVPDEDLVKYYQAADVFLLPTRELECFGLPVIEAMGCGCPPLVMPDGGPAEVCREFPERIAAVNTDEAFTSLVQRFLGGDFARRIEGVDQWARARYSEMAVRPTVDKLLKRVADG